MKKLVVIFLAVLMMAGLVLSGCNQNTEGEDKSWEKVMDKGEFIMGLDDSFPPMGFRNEKDEITGYDVDLAKEVCSRLGIKLVLQPINWDAKEQELNTGKIDCIWNGFTINDERKENLLFTKPYMNNRQVVVVKADSNYSELTDFDGKKLGLQSASSAADALAGAKDFKDNLKEVVEFKNNMMALMDLEAGGVDAVLMDEIVARYYIQMQEKAYKVIEESLASEEYGIGFRKNDESLMQKFQETLEAMVKDGKVAEISQKWFGKDISTIGK